METYSLTINPSPYKAWNREIVAHVSGVSIMCKNYARLKDSSIQLDVLKGVFEYIKERAKGVEWGELRFEKTKLGHYHLHTHFSIQGYKSDLSEIIREDDRCVLFEDLNDIFSSGKKHPALYWEITRVKHCFKERWLPYENKDILKHCELPTDSDVE